MSTFNKTSNASSVSETGVSKSDVSPLPGWVRSQAFEKLRIPPYDPSLLPK